MLQTFVSRPEFDVAQMYLENGKYLYMNGYIFRTNCNLFYSFVVSSKQKNSTIFSSAKVDFGLFSKKVTFIFDTVVLCFYSTAKKECFENIVSYNNSLDYYHHELLRYGYFNNGSFAVYSKINGKSPTSKKQIGKLLVDILSKNSISKMVTNTNGTDHFFEHNVLNNYYYLQHGDLYQYNVMCSNGNFVVIDTDTIGFYPPLFDFFHLLTINRRFCRIFLTMFFCGAYDVLLNKIFNACSDEQLIMFKDNSLALFLKLRKNRLNNNIKFLLKATPLCYIETKKLLSEHT